MREVIEHALWEFEEWEDARAMVLIKVGGRGAVP